MKPDKPTEKYLRDICGASDDAIEKLSIYVRMVQEWQAAINLVSPTTLPHIWQRHILDSAQILPIIKKQAQTSQIVDLGSGGGLPALVLAILGVEHMTMVESDTRKCVFLREVSRETNLTNTTILNQRLEKIIDKSYPIVTARALASLEQLVAWAQGFIQAQGTMIFPKGQDYQVEIDQLNKTPYSTSLRNIETIQSITDDKAAIITLHLV